MFDEIEVKLKKILSEIVGPDLSCDQIQLEDSFATLGINSHNFVKIVIAVEAEFKFEFEVTDLVWSQYQTLNDLVLKVKERINNSI